MLIRLFLLISAALLIATAIANAQDARPALRAEAIVTGNLVRIGDLVDNAGIVANVPVFRAPALGETGSVPASQVLEALRAHSLLGLDSGSIHHVSVTRVSRAVAPQEVESLLITALARDYNLGDVKDVAVSLDRPLRTIHIEPSVTEPARVAQLRYDARTGRFDATVEFAGASFAQVRLFGSAFATTQVVTLTRALNRGEVIKADDVSLQRLPRSRVAADAITSPDQAIGRALRNGASVERALRAADLMKPELVARGEFVTITYEVPGVLLSVRGKANESGAQGDVIDVINPQSNRTLRATVSGRGHVTAVGMTPRIIASADLVRNPPAGDK
jgi:flagellar basal body P-ring formation protein FlgA